MVPYLKQNLHKDEHIYKKTIKVERGLNPRFCESQLNELNLFSLGKEWQR